MVHPEIPGIRAIWIKRTKNSILKRSITAAPRNAPKGRLCSTAHDAAALIMTQLRKPPKTMTQNRNDQPRSALDRKQQSKNTGKKKCANTKSNSGDLDSARKERKKEEKKGKKTLERNGKQKFLDRNNNQKNARKRGKIRSEARQRWTVIIVSAARATRLTPFAQQRESTVAMTTRRQHTLGLTSHVRARGPDGRRANRASFPVPLPSWVRQSGLPSVTAPAARSLVHLPVFFPRRPTDCRSTESSYR